jgi:hypothetical protein
MDTVWAFLTSHEVWIGLVVGVVATWTAAYLPRYIKVVLLWLPRKAGGELVDFIKEAPHVATMRSDPRTAAPYVGYNLARLSVNLASVLFFGGLIAVYQIADPTWVSKWHSWVTVISAIGIALNAFRGLKHFVFIWFAYRTFFDPPKALANLKGADAKNTDPQQAAPTSDTLGSETRT